MTRRIQRALISVSDKAGIEVPLARLACLALNNLPDETRLAFQAVGMEGKTIHRYVAEGHGRMELTA